MTTEKIAVTVPQQTLSRARRAVKAGKAKNLSAYVSRALEQTTMLDELDVLLEQLLEASGGPMTSAERRQADAILSGDSTSAPVKRRR